MNELSEYLLQFKSLESHKIKFYDLHINDVNEDKSFYEKYIVYGKLGFVKFIVLDNEIIDHVFIAPKYISGIFWNKCVTIQEIKNVLYMYNLLPHTNTYPKKTIFGFINCEHKTPIKAIEKFALLHPVIDKFMWGTKYENPKIKDFEKINPFGYSLILSQLCKNKHDDIKLTINTKYSQSCISFEGTKDNIQYITITYDSIVKDDNVYKFNLFKGTSFENDIPADVMSILMTLPKIITYEDLLNDNITIHDVLLAIVLATKTDRDTSNIIKKFNDLLEKKEMLTDDVIVQIKDFLDTHYINSVIDDVLSKEKELIAKIIECTNEKKLKKIITDVRHKCTFDNHISERLIKTQLKYIISRLKNEFE